MYWNIVEILAKLLYGFAAPASALFGTLLKLNIGFLMQVQALGNSLHSCKRMLAPDITSSTTLVINSLLCFSTTFPLCVPSDKTLVWLPKAALLILIDQSGLRPGIPNTPPTYPNKGMFPRACFSLSLSLHWSDLPCGPSRYAGYLLQEQWVVNSLFQFHLCSPSFTLCSS